MLARTKTIRKTSKKTTPLSLDNPLQNTIKPEDASSAPLLSQIPEVKKEFSTESMLSALHDAESKKAVQKPWLKLERGIRMKFLRAYIEKHTELTNVERAELFDVLVEALDKRALSSKSQITYSPENGIIVEINALKITKNASGKTIFKVESPNKNTKKAKRQTGSDDD